MSNLKNAALAVALCAAMFDGHYCEKDLNHKGKHRCGGVAWTDAGAAQFYADQKNAADKLAAANGGDE
jgi:hypothetical protein